MGPRSGSLAFKRGDKGVPLGGAGAEEDQSMNCKAAVEIVSRNSQKGSCFVLWLAGYLSDDREWILIGVHSFVRYQQRWVSGS